MPETQAPSFNCPACRAKYPWSAATVGKVARCACGKVIHVPPSPAQAAATPPPSPPPPPPQRASQPAPSRRPSFAADQATAIDHLFARSDADQLPEEVEAELAGLEKFADDQAGVAVYNDFRDRTFPLALLVIGGLLMFAQVVMQTVRYDAPLVGSIIGSIIGVVINVVLMLVGVVLASRFGSIDFGPLNTALLKLTAIFIGPIVLGELVTHALGDDIAVALIGNACTILACWFLIYYLFALDGQQTMICVVAIGVVRIAVVTFIVGMLPFALGGPREVSFEDPRHPDQEQFDQAMIELEAQADDDF